MIKELIFQDRKWVQTYIGMTLYTGPDISKMEYSLPSGWKSMAFTFRLTHSLNAKMLDETTNGDKLYLQVKGNEAEMGDGGTIWIEYHQLLQNGGVLGSHLNHLYQAFKRAFTRKEVIACL